MYGRVTLNVDSQKEHIRGALYEVTGVRHFVGIIKNLGQI